MQNIMDLYDEPEGLAPLICWVERVQCCSEYKYSVSCVYCFHHTPKKKGCIKI